MSRICKTVLGVVVLLVFCWWCLRMSVAQATRAPLAQSATVSSSELDPNLEISIQSGDDGPSVGNRFGGLTRNFDTGSLNRPASHQREVEAAVNRVRTASTDTERELARRSLRQLLVEIFTEDMQVRENQAQEIEDRLAKLRQQYEARQQIRDEIIDLQLKVLEKDAAGLGFPYSAPDLFKSQNNRIRTGGNPNRSQPAGVTNVPGKGRGGMAGNNVPAVANDPLGTPPADRPLLPLLELKKVYPTVVSDLTNRGQFIESRDGKMYAYANTNYPAGPSVIRVVDSATGKLIATATIDSVDRQLIFTDEGVATVEPDARPGGDISFRLRVPLTTKDAAAPENFRDKNLSDVPASSLRQTSNPFSTSHSAAISDYSQLRKQYLDAQFTLQQVDRELKFRYEEMRKQKPDATMDEVIQQNPETGRSLAAARSMSAEFRRLHETKMRLLAIDLKGAQVARESARSKSALLADLFKKKAVAKSELDAQQAEADAAELEVERIGTLIGLFESIPKAVGDTSDPEK